MTEHNIWTVDDKKEEAFLRKKTKPFTFRGDGSVEVAGTVLSKKEINDLILRMKKIMHAANGIGLSANQIGLEYRLFVAQVQSSQGENKFYAIFNPEFEKMSAEKETMEEGCLSVPGVYGDMTRPREVTLKGFDKAGRAVKIKAWGLIARVFQHEVDHLNGTLFIDKAKNLSREPHSKRLQKRESEINQE
jgi:peptide deformylase